jgi:hypothetical protein
VVGDGSVVGGTAEQLVLAAGGVETVGRMAGLGEGCLRKGLRPGCS